MQVDYNVNNTEEFYSIDRIGSVKQGFVIMDEALLKLVEDVDG